MKTLDQWFLFICDCLAVAGFFGAIWLLADRLIGYIERKVDARRTRNSTRLEAMRRISRDNGGVWHD